MSDAESTTPLTWSLLTPEDPQYARSLTGEVLGVRLLFNMVEVVQP